MSGTPAHVGGARALPQAISAGKDEILNVQKLFFGRRYKQCIALCEQLQKPELYCLHQSFLWFYRGLSYESLAFIAHDFSNNKIQFLESARQSLSMAMRVLPSPLGSPERYSVNRHGNSPRASSYTSSATHNMSSDGHDTPCPGSVFALRSRSASFEVTPIEGASPSPWSAPQNNEKILQCNAVADHSPHFRDLEHVCVDLPTTPVRIATYQSGLCRSTESTNTLAQDLIPSPLFSRTAKHAGTCFQHESLAARPLPPLPFNHSSMFQAQGGRVIQLPVMRRTAVQTLVARYEGQLPFAYSPPTSPSEVWLRPKRSDSSPSLTPRFQMIRDAFTPDPPNAHLDNYLTSIDLGRYNSLLSDFRAQLRKNLAFLEKDIRRVHQAQAERAATKALSKNRYASFWSFQDCASVSKRTRLSPSGRHTSGKSQGDQDDGPHPRPRNQVLEDRIAKLKQRGWQVRKEDHGFKGVDWYDGLRSRVAAELGSAAAA